MYIISYTLEASQNKIWLNMTIFMASSDQDLFNKI